jgi:hypothetical protein
MQARTRRRFLEKREKSAWKIRQIFQRKCGHIGPKRDEREVVCVWILVLSQNRTAETCGPSGAVTGEGRYRVSLYSYCVIIQKYLRCRWSRFPASSRSRLCWKPGETDRVCDCTRIRDFFRDYTRIVRAYTSLTDELPSSVRARASIGIYR